MLGYSGVNDDEMLNHLASSAEKKHGGDSGGAVNEGKYEAPRRFGSRYASNPMHMAANNAMQDNSNDGHVPLFGGHHHHHDAPHPHETKDEHDGAGDTKSKWVASGEEAQRQDQEMLQRNILLLKQQNEQLERARLMHQLKRMAGEECPTSSSKCSTHELRKLAQEHKMLKRGDFVVRMMRRMLLFTSQLTEEVSKQLDKEKKVVDLTGWAQSFELEMQNYEELLYDIYDYYLTDINSNPVATLAFAMVTSAACHSMQRRICANPLFQMLGVGGGADSARRGAMGGGFSIKSDDDQDSDRLNLNASSSAPQQPGNIDSSSSSQPNVGGYRNTRMSGAMLQRHRRGGRSLNITINTNGNNNTAGNTGENSTDNANNVLPDDVSSLNLTAADVAE